MKKNIIAILAILAISAAPSGLAFAQTAPSANLSAQQVLTIEQDLLALYQQLNTLIDELNAIENNPQLQSSQPAATAIQSSPVLGDVSSPTNDPTQDPTIEEKAEINLGSGFSTGSDSNPLPSTTPGQNIAGEIGFNCVYNLPTPGTSGICSVTPGSTSTVPEIASVELTIQFKESLYVCNNGEPISANAQETQTAATDGNGNFSFTAPTNPNIEGYTITIADEGDSIFWGDVSNSAAIPASAVCPGSGN